MCLVTLPFENKKNIIFFCFTRSIIFFAVSLQHELSY